MLFLSLGENCMPDRWLRDYSLKSFSTPFSSCLGNIDYILELERNNYNDFMNNDFIVRKKPSSKQIVSLKYIDADPIFSDSVSNGFVFCHHDVIGNSSHQQSVERKIARLKEIKREKDVCFLYHYRHNHQMDIALVVKKLNMLAELYSTWHVICSIMLIYQTILTLPQTADMSSANHDQRCELIIHERQRHVRPFEFRTLQTWGGNNTAIFYARHDRDLVDQMIEFMKVDAYYGVSKWRKFFQYFKHIGKKSAKRCSK